jgi:hypothetical protein
LAATSLILIGGGTLIMSTKPEPQSQTRSDEFVDDPRAVTRQIPSPPPIDDSVAGLHAVSYTIENGVRVVKIRVVPDGDELTVDVATGRLLESRPSRPTAPPPMGKFAAPFEPMT